MKNNEFLSPSQIAWRRYKSNAAGMISLIFIILCALMAIFAYFIIPDSTPDANTQILEISTQKPGFEVDILLVNKPTKVEKVGFLRKLAGGQPSPYRQIPFDSIRIGEKTTTVYVFNPEGSGSVQEEVIDNDLLPENPVVHRKYRLGTDQFGRDFLSRLVLGTRISFSVGFIAVLLSVVIGLFIGGLGGFFRGRVDDVTMWLINVVWSIPTVLMVIAITFALGKGFWQVFIAIGLTMWVDVARIVRGQVMAVKQTEYVEAARALGYRTPRIIMRHILPNIIGPVIVVTASNFASAILLEAGLSFLGIGVQPPMPSWGSMVKENYSQILLDSAYQAIIPGVAIMVIVLAFMLLGNGIRDALDIKGQQQ